MYLVYDGCPHVILDLEALKILFDPFCDPCTQKNNHYPRSSVYNSNHIRSIKQINHSFQLITYAKEINILWTHNWKGGQVCTSIEMMKESHYQADMALPNSLLFLKLAA